MAQCDNVIGVKNILITFRNCATNAVVGPISHMLAKEDLPMWRLYEFKQEKLPGGYVKRHHISPECEMDIIRDLRIPLLDYQGRSQLDIQVEYDNGLVYTGTSGGIQGEEKSDTHEVRLAIAFKTLTELLPPGALIAA